MAAADDEDGDRSLWAAALAVWPADWVTREVFLDYLHARVPPDRAPEQALPEIAVADIYLACACARGVPAALAAFSRTILAEVDAHVARFRDSPAFADEVKQELAAKLLVAAPGETPKIADYAGAAPLSAWVRVAAIRIALNLRRGKARAVEHRDERAIADLAAAGDADVDLIRLRYGAAFETALADALVALPTRQRTLLRLRVVDGVEVEHMATTSGLLPISTAAFAVAVFIADTSTHLDIAVAVLYVPVVLMASRFCRRRGVVLVAAGCLGLTALSYFVTPLGPRPAAITNALISVSTIGLTTFIIYIAAEASRGAPVTTLRCCCSTSNCARSMGWKCCSRFAPMRN